VTPARPIVDARRTSTTISEEMTARISHRRFRDVERNTSGIHRYALPPAPRSPWALAQLDRGVSARRVAPPPVSAYRLRLPSRRSWGFQAAFALVRVSPSERVGAGCSWPSLTRGPCTRLLAEGATPAQVRLVWSSFFRWMSSRSTDSRRAMACGSRTGRDFGSLAFAVTTLALGSPWPSWSLYRARVNR